MLAGLAAAYILRDEFDTGAEPNPIGIPGGPYEIPLVIQDRQFNPDGTFFYPTSDIPGVVWIGEYFGDVMLVNGKVWPFLDVEPRLYRFRILNGCNARILNLDLAGARMWQIGAEGGMWDMPVPVKRIVLAPAERADVLVDFSSFAGARLPMQNLKPPRSVSTPAPPLTQVMQIRVGTRIRQPGPSAIPRDLPGRAANLIGPVARTRYITLNEIDPEEVEWYLNLNGVRFDEGPITESPTVGAIRSARPSSAACVVSRETNDSWLSTATIWASVARARSMVCAPAPQPMSRTRWPRVRGGSRRRARSVLVRSPGPCRGMAS